MRLAFLLTGHRQHAEDLAQEAFVRCVGRFRHLRKPDAFEAYFRRAIVNLHTSGLRRRRLEREWLTREGAANVRRVSSQPDVGAREDLWRALGTLPAELLPLCAELTEHSPHELAKASPSSRATVYRQVRELRLCLLVAGIPARA